MAVVMAWGVYWGRWEGVRMRVRGVRCRKRRAGSAWEEGRVRRSLSRVISAEAWEAIARVSRWTSRGSWGKKNRWLEVSKKSATNERLARRS